MVNFPLINMVLNIFLMLWIIRIFYEMRGDQYKHMAKVILESINPVLTQDTEKEKVPLEMEVSEK